MTGRNEIQLNYKRALRQADELDRLARQLKDLEEQNCEDALEGIRNAWEGENAGDFGRKGQRINLLIRQHSSTLRETAAVLRRTAVNTYRAELRSIEIAERRKYH